MKLFKRFLPFSTLIAPLVVGIFGSVEVQGSDDCVKHSNAVCVWWGGGVNTPVTTVDSSKTFNSLEVDINKFNFNANAISSSDTSKILTPSPRSLELHLSGNGKKLTLVNGNYGAKSTSIYFKPENLIDKGSGYFAISGKADIEYLNSDGTVAKTELNANIPDNFQINFNNIGFRSQSGYGDITFNPSSNNVTSATAYVKGSGDCPGSFCYNYLTPFADISARYIWNKGDKKKRFNIKPILLAQICNTQNCENNKNNKIIAQFWVHGSALPNGIQIPEPTPTTCSTITSGFEHNFGSFTVAQVRQAGPGGQVGAQHTGDLTLACPGNLALHLQITDAAPATKRDPNKKVLVNTLDNQATGVGVALRYQFNNGAETDINIDSPSVALRGTSTNTTIDQIPLKIKGRLVNIGGTEVKSGNVHAQGIVKITYN